MSDSPTGTWIIPRNLETNWSSATSVLIYANARIIWNHTWECMRRCLYNPFSLSMPNNILDVTKKSDLLLAQKTHSLWWAHFSSLHTYVVYSINHKWIGTLNLSWFVDISQSAMCNVSRVLLQECTKGWRNGLPFSWLRCTHPTLQSTPLHSTPLTQVIK